MLGAGDTGAGSEVRAGADGGAAGSEVRAGADDDASSDFGAGDDGRAGDADKGATTGTIGAGTIDELDARWPGDVAGEPLDVCDGVRRSR